MVQEFHRKTQTLYIVVDNGNGWLKIYGNFPGGYILVPNFIRFVSSAKKSIDGWSPSIFRYESGSSKLLMERTFFSVGEIARLSGDYERISDDDKNKGKYALPVMLAAIINSKCLTSPLTRIVCIASCHDLDGVGKILNEALSGYHKISLGDDTYEFEIVKPTNGVVMEGSAIDVETRLVSVTDYGQKTVINRITRDGDEIVDPDYERAGVSFLHQMIANSPEMRALLGGKGDPVRVDDAIRGFTSKVETKTRKVKDASGKFIEDSNGNISVETKDVTVHEMPYRHQGKVMNIYSVYKVYFYQWVERATSAAIKQINSIPTGDEIKKYAIGGGALLPLMKKGLEVYGIEICPDPQLVNVKSIYDNMLLPAIEEQEDLLSKEVERPEVKKRQPKEPVAPQPEPPRDANPDQFSDAKVTGLKEKANGSAA